LTSPGSEIPFHKRSFGSEALATTHSLLRATRKAIGHDAKGFVELFLESQAVLHQVEGYGLRDVNHTPTQHNNGGNQKSRVLEEILEVGEMSEDEMSDEGLFIVPIDESRRVVSKSAEKGYQSGVMDIESLS
jgi:hypothetical protein